jgi:hypothetical protein
MSAPDPFDRLLHQAFRTQSLPPVPPALLAHWTSKHAKSGSAWLWLLPGLVFTGGLVLGVLLAPLGLSAAFVSLQAVFTEIVGLLPKDALVWLLAVALALTVLFLDGVFRSGRLPMMKGPERGR